MSDIDEEPKYVMASEAPAHHPSYLYKTYFNYTTSSDLSIKLSNNEIFHAHRIILCRLSAYFAKLLDGSFEVSIVQTADRNSPELIWQLEKQL